MAKPYCKRFPNEPHAVSIRIDNHEFKYNVPDSKGGDGKWEGGWKALVRFINDVDYMIEHGDMDTRLDDSDTRQPVEEEALGQHSQVIPEKEDLSF